MKHDVKITRTSRRSCFYRGETAVLRFDLMNLTAENCYDAELVLDLAGYGRERRSFPKIGWHQSNVEFRVDTGMLRTGDHPFELQLRADGKRLRLRCDALSGGTPPDPAASDLSPSASPGVNSVPDGRCSTRIAPSK